jgi:hypothetical protein
MSSGHKRIKRGVTVALMLVSGLMTCGAFAQAGGRPLVLDTQTGIHSGADGTVLQSGSSMVPARPMATLRELPQQDQQQIVVSPYIELQSGGRNDGGQVYGSSSRTTQGPSTPGYQHRPRSTAPHSGNSYGVPAGAQPQTHTPTRPAPHSPIAEPVAPPIPVATPNKPIATRPTASSHSSGPHSATGSVTTSLE